MLNKNEFLQQMMIAICGVKGGFDTKIRLGFVEAAYSKYIELGGDFIKEEHEDSKLLDFILNNYEIKTPNSKIVVKNATRQMVRNSMVKHESPTPTYKTEDEDVDRSTD